MSEVVEVFLKKDQKSGRWRVQPMGWVAVGLVVVLSAAGGCACWREATGPELQITPTVEPSPTPEPTKGPTATPGPTDTPRPTATSIVHEACPSNPAMWDLVEYELIGVGKKYTMVKQVCVMEAVEEGFRAYVDRSAEDRLWTEEDGRLYQSWRGYTTALSGEEIPPVQLSANWWRDCRRGYVLPEDRPMTSADMHLAFVSISDEDPTVASLLVVNTNHLRTRVYDCETGEVTEVTETEPGTTMVMYTPMLYEDGRWKVAASGIDSFARLEGEGPLDTVTVFLQSQGRY